jgi:hypothetical protein
MSIRNRIAVRYAVNRARHSKKSINFNEVVKKAETAVFFMPRMSMEFYLARSVIESLSRYFRRVVLVVTENMRELLPKGFMGTVHHGEIVQISEESENWLRLPSNDLISQLRHENFDIGIDLNLSDDIFMSYLCRRSEPKVSTGFSKTNCDHFYDIEIKLPSSGDAKRAYGVLVNTIKMFKEK